MSRLKTAPRVRLHDPEPYVYEGPTPEETAYLQLKEQEFADKLQALLDSDDALATATAKWRRADLLLEQLLWRFHGLMNENAELVRTVKYWRRRALERQP